MAKTPRERQIGEWLDRIGRSPLSPRQYLASHRVPFSLAQFYRYRAVYEREGVEGLADARARGNHRRIHIEAEDLLRWYVSTHEGLTGRDLREALKGSFGIEVTPRGLNKCLRRLGIHMERPKREEAITKRADPNAGFQLVLALAWHFGWPQATASMIAKAITQGKASKRFARPQDD
ncbi:MAG: helix-turn-helix domain-containing protein, partial [Planctomycetes bacterium]|nr:helix-turn-helix domain-containing protein [Planctomycetota bacterium]